MKKIIKASFSNEPAARELENRKVAYKAALEGIVLLENDGMLPLKPCRAALFGAGAAMTIKGGTGSGEVNERHSVTIMEGLENAGFTIATKKWIDDYTEAFRQAKESHSQKLKKKMFSFNVNNIMSCPFRYPFGREITDDDIRESDTDTCIYVVSRQAGEFNDRRIELNDYNLSETELINLKKAAASYKKTILVINVGSSIDMGFMDDIKINAVIFFCQQGTEGGNALADIICGKASPSGRLSDSWARNYSDIPFASEYSYLNGDVDNEYYREGIYVGYRYFDSFNVSPRYEFGYGLGYTDFKIAVDSVSAVKTTVQVNAKVRNTGNYAGKEVVQLYLSCPDSRLHREFQSLAAFAKTDELKPGEAQEIKLTFDLKEFAAYDEKSASYVLEKGEYVLRLGRSSRKTEVCAVIAVDGDIITEKCSNICNPQIKIEELELPKTKETNKYENIVRISISAADVPAIVHEYTTPPINDDPEVTAILESLSVDEMIEVVVGAGMFGSSPRLNVPGAAALTTSKLYDKGVRNIALCDGPAGLRLQRTSIITKRGKIKAIDVNIEIISLLPAVIKKFFFGNPKKGKLIYQYATAFPVGTALAQTWNTEILESAGKAVGIEMAEYGVTFLLAPGMNIHRNPLCGRNFEYYSEDPLLSGKMAAAFTRGVQSHKGRFVTIKHFTANNQETNRNKVSSNINERALREIYLKGFGIAVREGGAFGVMTSYNKVNQVYAPNSYDLCTKVLRNEWGFKGVVMTDWFSTGKDLAGSGLALKIGNDLIMPGGKSYKKAVKRDLKAGIVSEDDIRRCCANVLKAILSSPES